MKRIQYMLCVSAAILTFSQIAPCRAAIVDEEHIRLSPIEEQGHGVLRILEQEDQIQQEIWQKIRQQEKELEEKECENKGRRIKKNAMDLLYARDKAMYNRILKIVVKILNPVIYKEESCGGPARLTAAAMILESLKDIHDHMEYCTDPKTMKLDELFQQASDARIRLDGSRKLKNEEWKIHCRNRDIDLFIKNLKEKRVTTSLGANLGAACSLGVGLGGSIGISKSPDGSRKPIGMVNLVGFLGYSALSAMGGIYRFDADKMGSLVMSGSITPFSGGCVVGGTVMTPRIARWLEHSNPETTGYVEAGIIAGFQAVKGIFVFGIEAGPTLPPDLKHFRKQIGLTPESGVFPFSLQHSLDTIKCKEDLDRWESEVKTVIG